jgi:hypothetical protein
MSSFPHLISGRQPAWVDRKICKMTLHTCNLGYFKVRDVVVVVYYHYYPTAITITDRLCGLVVRVLD